MKVWRHHGLSLTLALLFAGTLCIGQFLTGRRQYNEERQERGLPAVSGREYWLSPHFLEATAENWESEFFQMFVFVTLTTFLHQKGSAQSNDPDRPAPAPAPLVGRSPWAARRGGWIRTLYEHSLSLALAGLFVVSFTLHAVAGAKLRNEEETARQHPSQTVIEYMGSSRFWFESFQNWQSEFLAIGTMVVLTIFLRERNSPESKPVNLPNGENE